MTMSIGDTNNKTMGKRPGKRPGRKPSKIDERAKLERSRQSARECRARKKLRYQYLEELVSNREKAVFALRDELELYKQWCIQLENGGPVPEALLKMIASEEVSIKRRQMAQATRSLRQQQQHQNSQFSSSLSSTTSPDLSSASSPREQPQHRHVNVVQPQMIISDVVHKSQICQPVSGHVSPQRHQQLQLQQLPRRDQTSATTIQQRQFDIDNSRFEEHQPEEITPNLNNLPLHPVSQEQIKGGLFQQSICSQQQQQRPFLPVNQHQQPSPTLPSHGAYSSFFSENTSRAMLMRKSQELLLPRVNSEPQIKHGHSVDISRVSSDSRRDKTELSGNMDIHRKRSNSNPVTMASVVRPNVSITSADDLPSPLQDFITSHSSSFQAGSQPHLGFGLFSGSMINSKPNSFFNLPTTVAMDDYSSSDDSINEEHLFQSSMTSQKRKVAVPLIHESAKRSLASANHMSLIPTVTNFDPNTGLLNVDDLHYFGLATASSTPSPSSYGHSSSNAPSPSRSPRYSGLSHSTSSSCITASPAPLSPLSSILELSVSSPGISPSTYSLAMEISPSIPSTLISQSTDSTSASHHDLVPDWYSFLADLEDQTPSSLTFQQGTSSAMTLIPKHHPQPFTPNQSFMNVPDIINEMLNPHHQPL